MEEIVIRHCGHNRFVLLTVLLLVGAVPGLRAASFSTVVLDAGHGGHDRGGIPSNIIPEKGVALDTAKRVSAILRNAGLRTVMTRSSDVFIPLGRRCEIANAQSRAIFVSIHYNSAPRTGARGIESFYRSPASRTLAALIQRRAAATTTGDNRGVKRAGFYVLRHTRSTAVLIECGFLTNPTDARQASNAAYREKLARAIAGGILEYRRSY